MPDRIPKLRRKKNGSYFVRFGDKDHYCGTTDAEKAQKIYPKLLESWSNWRVSVRTMRTISTSTTLTIKRLGEEFIQAKVAQRGPQIERYYRTQLKMFLELYGPMPASTFTAQRLQAFQSTIIAKDIYQPKSINHFVVAVKAMFNWGADMNLVPAIRLRAIKALPLGEPANKSLSLNTIKGWIGASDENGAAWLAVNYLTLARPIEVCRVVNKVGNWEEHGVFRLGKSKVEFKTGVAKRLVFSDEALDWLRNCKPIWSRSDSYWHGVREHVPNAKPGLLRHSAATHLIRNCGVHRLDVETLLGHSSAIRRESVRYAAIEWQQYREIASKLTLR